jgi:phage recombination protein Bet
MSTALQKIDPIGNHAMTCFDDKQIQLFKELYCKGLTDDESKLFLSICQRTGLDPTVKQIYAVKRKDWKLGREVMTIQTGIDGFRLIADRTGRYCPGDKETNYVYDENGKLKSATVFIKKQTRDGTWHEFPSKAMFSEYVQSFKDKNTGEMVPNGMWSNMPSNQLAKCAEALGLRRAFPQELSGIYIKEEMEQAYPQSAIPATDSPDVVVADPVITCLATEQVIELQNILNKCDPIFQEKVKTVYLTKKYKVACLDDVSATEYGLLKGAFEEKAKEYQKQIADTEASKEVQSE